ncbi:MAG TPA: MoaD/ThiS family protein [Thermoanaerobacterales bacterium]|jgi:molybdopterin synthase sulfur carrier subunit|nr:MoaD/ThiS family protein [Thermoanaerobacterales bacterium]
MKVKFYSYIRDYTRCKAVDVSGCSTIRELLCRLCELYGKKFHDAVFKEEELSNEIIILVNGRNIHFLDQLDTSINEDDEVTIFPVVAGG